MAVSEIPGRLSLDGGDHEQRQRFFGGIVLVEQGLKFWKFQNDSVGRGGRGAKGTAQSAEFVDRVWDGKLGDHEHQPGIGTCWRSSVLTSNSFAGEHPK
jgi:hypothetical protein